VTCSDSSSPASTICNVPGSGAGVSTYTNSSTGTTVNVPVILVNTSGSLQAQIAANGATTGIIGICTSGCSTSGTATVTTAGSGVSCVFDGATTAGHPVVMGIGACHDPGANAPVGVQVLGYVQSTNGSGGTYTMSLNPSTSLQWKAGFGLLNAMTGVTNAAAVDTAVFATKIVQESGACNVLVSNNGTTAYTPSLAGCQALTAYTQWQVFALVVDTTCSSSCTINIDGLGIKSIKQSDGVTDPGGTLIANRPRNIAYNGSVFVLF
jgi:hypothetical protein